MKEELTKSQKRIGGIIILIAVVFLYQFFQSEKAINDQVVLISKKEVTPFFTLQKNENGLYTPENYLLDYYSNINNKNWDYVLKHSLKQYNKDFIKGQFSYKELKGVEVVSVEKENKEMALVSANITFVNSKNDTISKRINAQLQLAKDYQTWIVSPLTVF